MFRVWSRNIPNIFGSDTRRIHVLNKFQLQITGVLIEKCNDANTTNSVLLPFSFSLFMTIQDCRSLIQCSSCTVASYLWSISVTSYDHTFACHPPPRVSVFDGCVLFWSTVRY